MTFSRHSNYLLILFSFAFSLVVICVVGITVFSSNNPDTKNKNSSTPVSVQTPAKTDVQGSLYTLREINNNEDTVFDVSGKLLGVKRIGNKVNLQVRINEDVTALIDIGEIGYKISYRERLDDGSPETNVQISTEEIASILEQKIDESIVFTVVIDTRAVQGQNCTGNCKHFFTEFLLYEQANSNFYNDITKEDASGEYAIGGIVSVSSISAR